MTLSVLPSLAHAHCVVLDSATPLPDWIELLPAGPAIVGADGRAWTLPDPQTVITAFQQRGKPLVVDWEHATEHRAPQGLDAPAAGWIDQMDVRTGAVWGHVDWTERAAQQIAAKEYRFLSPVFSYRVADRAIVALTSAALTNTPNLTLTALNAETPAMDDSLLEQLRYLFNLPTLATVADIRAQLETLITQLDAQTATAGQRLSLSEYLTAVNAKAETPSLDRFVPRADYDAALARASNAETQLAAQQKAAQDAEIEILIQNALTAKKIIPATTDYYRAMCQMQDGIAAFKGFLEKTPELLPASGLEGKAPPQATALNRATFESKSPHEQHAFLAAGGRVTD